MTQLTCSRLVTFVYLKLTQMLILKVVYNNSINGLQCYSFKILIRPCYGWDTSNGSWGLFWFSFCTCPIKTTPRITLLAFVLWHQKKSTQSVIKLFSEIIDSQCLTDTSQVFVGQWILFCVSSLLLYGRQRDFYMLIHCMRAQKSIIQLPSLG